MPFADKRFRIRKDIQNGRVAPHVPMGEQRFQQLVSELGAAFAQIDDDEEKRRQARERDCQHEVWMARREDAIEDILRTMRLHELSIQDLA